MTSRSHNPSHRATLPDVYIAININQVDSILQENLADTGSPLRDDKVK